MKLFIDTSKKDNIKIAIDDVQFEMNDEKLKNKKVLEFIISCLKKQNLEIKDISEIDFFEGPGSFTGLRVGASILSVISWEYKIPVNGNVIDRNHFLKIVY